MGDGSVNLGYGDALRLSLLTEVPEFMHLAVPIRPDLLNAVLLRDYQMALLQRAAAAMRAGYRRVLIVLPTGGGKCLGKGTPVLMYDGTVKPVEDVVAGDRLIGPDSKPRQVLSTCTGSEELFRVTPRKGDSYVVNRSHILSLRLTGGVAKTPNPGRLGGNYPGQVVNISVADYLKKSGTFRHIAKGWRTGVEFPVRSSGQHLDPYFLGLWLGDGHSRTTGITTDDEETVRYLYDFANGLGLKVRREVVGERCAAYFLSTGRKTGGVNNNPLLHGLKEYDLIKNKHIPHQFKTASRSDRLALLAGLVDSDGHLSKNDHYDFVFKSETLARGIEFVARSLGFAAYVKECRKTCRNNGAEGTHWRLSVTGGVEEIPVKVERKRSGPRAQVKNVLNVGISVESIGDGDYYGFEIDGDRLFLLGDFTVTHNTVLAGEALKCSASLGFLGQFLVHRKELIDQTSRSFTGMGLPHGFAAAGRPTDAAITTLAGVQTLVNRLDVVLPPNLLIIDEAHHSPAASWARIFAAYPDAFVLGLTATPERLDGKGLDSQFDIMIEGPTVAELIERGFLSPFDYYAPSRPDFVGVRSEQQAESVMDQPDLIGDMVEHYLRLAAGQPGIVFAHSVAHSRNLIDAYAANGVRAAHIDGDMSDKERERVDAMFRARDVDILSNCALLGEGYDVPGVVYLGQGRRTQSLSWYRQMSGRAFRPIYETGFGLSDEEHRRSAIALGPKPRAIVCDHAANVFTHGFPDDDVTWSLKGREGRQATGGNDDAEPVRQCLTCYRAYPSVMKACPGCGAAQTASPREMKIAAGQLEKLEREAAKLAAQAKRKTEEQACTCYADFYDLAVSRGYDKPAGWARMKAELKVNYRGRR